MHNNTFHLLGIGLICVIIGAGLLLAMVGRELAPGGGLTARGRWLLATGLGTGVIAFAAKLALILFILARPQWLVAPSIALANHRVEPPPPALYDTPASGRYVWQALPLQAPSPAENPWSTAKAALGERLFHDRRLSADGRVACADCHALQRHAGADGRPRAIGIHQQQGPRNTPTVWNAAFAPALFWDARADSLEAQALGPLFNPKEMGLGDPAELEQWVRDDGDYRREFAAAFGPQSPIDLVHIARAIAAYERTLITPQSPYDRFVRGEQGALTPAQLRGMALFAEVGCVQCHSGANFSDGTRRLFPANPTPFDARYRLHEEANRTWRVPSLRNVARTAPYFHNGAVATLEEAVRVMASAQLALPLAGQAPQPPLWSEAEQALAAPARAPLDDAQVADLVAFLHALTGDALQSGESELVGLARHQE